MERALYAVGTEAAKIAVRQMSKSKGPYLRGSRNKAKYQRKKTTWLDRPSSNHPPIRQLDFAPVRTLGRRHVILQDATKNSRQIYQVDLLNIPQTGANHALNTRTRHVINCLGFNLTFSIRNLATRNMLANWAVIAVRNGSSINSSNFFRGDGAGDRGTDFGVVRTGLENHMMTVNSDDYIVLTKGRNKVGPSSSTEGNDSWIWQKYVPCRTQVRYDSVGEPHQHIYFCYWYDFDDSNRNEVIQADQADVQYRVETIFHNIE